MQAQRPRCLLPERHSNTCVKRRGGATASTGGMDGATDTVGLTGTFFYRPESVDTMPPVVRAHGRCFSSNLFKIVKRRTGGLVSSMTGSGSVATGRSDNRRHVGSAQPLSARLNRRPADGSAPAASVVRHPALAIAAVCFRGARESHTKLQVAGVAAYCGAKRQAQVAATAHFAPPVEHIADAADTSGAGAITGSPVCGPGTGCQSLPTVGCATPAQPPAWAAFALYRRTPPTSG